MTHKKQLKSLSLGILIPTYNGAKHIEKCLKSLLKASQVDRILIIDSGSTDETLQVLQKYNLEIMTIAQKDFQHGKVREVGRKMLGTDIVVMMTQDAYLTTPDTVAKLIKPLVDRKAAATYARQIPHTDANMLAKFHREFNYPKVSYCFDYSQLDSIGAKLFFFSNSCAAYLNQALDEVGGFSQVDFAEDTLVVAKLLKAGYKVAYVSDAQVYHSHNYTLKDEFKRHILIGNSRQQLANEIGKNFSDHKRGGKYCLELIQMLWQKEKKTIPYAFLQLITKYLGYFIGKNFRS